MPSSSNSCAVSGHFRKRLPRDVHALVYADFTSAFERKRCRSAASETIILNATSSRVVEDVGKP